MLSSKFSLPFAWITGPATDPSFARILCLVCYSSPIMLYVLTSQVQVKMYLDHLVQNVWIIVKNLLQSLNSSLVRKVKPFHLVHWPLTKTKHFFAMMAYSINATNERWVRHPKVT